nr:MAG TPA: hypothetical protein [Caudoviricetes sp.]
MRAVPLSFLSEEGLHLRLSPAPRYGRRRCRSRTPVRSPITPVGREWRSAPPLPLVPAGSSARIPARIPARSYAFRTVLTGSAQSSHERRANSARAAAPSCRDAFTRKPHRRPISANRR